MESTRVYFWGLHARLVISGLSFDPVHKDYPTCVPQDICSYRVMEACIRHVSPSLVYYLRSAQAPAPSQRQCNVNSSP